MHPMPQVSPCLALLPADGIEWVTRAHFAILLCVRNNCPPVSCAPCWMIACQHPTAGVDVPQHIDTVIHCPYSSRPLIICSDHTDLACHTVRNNAPAGTAMTCTNGLAVRNTGNVRISFTGMSSATTATPSGSCVGTDVLPGDAVQCTIQQQVTQADLEAGSATVTVTVEGMSAWLSPQGAVTPLPATMGQTIHPAITQTKTFTYAFERTDTQGNIAVNGGWMAASGLARARWTRVCLHACARCIICV
jgi:hypothetical protein